jgi:hypothetical protein
LAIKYIVQQATAIKAAYFNGSHPVRAVKIDIHQQDFSGQWPLKVRFAVLEPPQAYK